MFTNTNFEINVTKLIAASLVIAFALSLAA